MTGNNEEAKSNVGWINTKEIILLSYMVIINKDQSK